MNPLRTAVVACLFASVSTVATAKPAESPVNYRLTMPAVEACHAAIMTLLKRVPTDATIRGEQDRLGAPPGDTPAEFAAYLRKNAPASSALMTENGCSPDQHAKVGLSIGEAMIAQGVLEDGGKASDLPQVVRDNIDFLQKNTARLDAMEAESNAAEQAAARAARP